MADFSIEGGLNLNITAALASVGNVGKRIDELIGKATPLPVDTKPAEKEIKSLGDVAEKTFKKIGEDAEKAVSGAGGGGLFAGLKESFAKGQSEAGNGGGIFGSLAGSLGQLASPIGAATAGIGLLTAGLAESFQVGAEFQKNLAAVSAITGITGAGLDDIGVRAQDLAAKFGGTATTQLESFQGVLSRFGAQLADTPDDLGKVSESINLLAKAGGIDAASAMDTLTTAMLQFGVDTSNSSELASESARFINVMAASARVGAAEIPQVGEAVRVAGVAMKGAKVSFEEGNAAIQVLAAGGKVGAEAGTALRNVLGKIAGEEVIPKEALAKLKSLGVDMKKVSDTATPLADRLAELGKASKDATAFSQVFGSDNAAAATILAQGAGTVRDWTKEITGTQDASKQAAINMGTFTEQIGRAKAAFENTLINVNKVLSPILAQVFGTLTQVFSSVYNAIAPVFSRLGATLSATFERIAAVAKPILAFIGGYIITYLVTTITAAGTILDALLQTAIKVFDGIIAAVQPIVDAFKKAFNITDDVTKSFDPLQTFQKILTTITDVISFFGSVLVEIGSFIAQWLIAPIRLGATVVGLLIEPIVNIGKHIFGFGEATKSAGGFFETFIGIVKEAPGFIRAVTAGFSAFVGSIGDLLTNFSFDKLKNLLTGKTISDAFIGSIDETKLKERQKVIEEKFGEGIARLTELRKKANLDKDAKDKAADSAAFDAEKTRLLNAVNEKEKIRELDKDSADKLRVKIQALTLAGAKEEADAANKAADKAGKEKKEKLTDIAKDIAKINRDIAAATANAQAITDRSELSEAKQKQQKQLDDLRISLEKETQALRDADEEKQKNDKISADQKKAFHEATLGLIAAKEKESNTKRAQINGEFADKQIELIDKKSKKELSAQEELIKKQIIAQKELGSTSTEEEMTRLANLNDLQIALLKATAEKKFAAMVANNDEVLKAGEDLKAALLTEDKAKIESAKQAYAAIKEEARKSDAAVLEARKQLNDDIAQTEKEGALAIREASLADIKDRTERERQTRLLEVDKTLTAELDKAKGSFTLIQAAEQKAADARLKIEADYAKKTAGVWQTLTDSVIGLFGGVQDALKGAFESNNDAQNQAVADAKKANEQQEKDLLVSLKNKSLSFADYQNKVRESQDKLNETISSNSVNFLSKFVDGFGKALDGISANFKKTADGLSATWAESGAKIGQTDVQIKALQTKLTTATGAEREDLNNRIKTLNEQRESEEAKSAGVTTQIYNAMALSTAASFGSAIAEGKKNFGEYVILALDALESLVPIISAQIFGLYAASPNPVNIFGLGIPGAVAAAVTTLAFTGLVELAKAGIRGSKHDGGYTGDGDEWEVGGVYHRKEYIVSAAGVKGEVSAFDRLHGILKSGESLTNILSVYERPELSASYVGANGLVITPVQYTSPTILPTANGAMTQEIQQLRYENRQMHETLKGVLAATELIPTTFHGNMDFNFKVESDPGHTLKLAEYDNRRKALQGF